MISDIIVIVKREMAAYRPPLGSGRGALDELDARAIEQLGCRLPASYLEFLSLMDGFYVSSMQLFGSHQHPLILERGGAESNVLIEDVVEANLELRIEYPALRDSIMLTSDSGFRGWESTRGIWYRMYAGDRSRTYRNFGELLADGLWEVGVDIRGLMPRDFEFSSRDANGNKVYGERAR
jgi:hypothetical protein